VKLSN